MNDILRSKVTYGVATPNAPLFDKSKWSGQLFLLFALEFPPVDQSRAIILFSVIRHLLSNNQINCEYWLSTGCLNAMNIRIRGPAVSEFDKLWHDGIPKNGCRQVFFSRQPSNTQASFM